MILDFHPGLQSLNLALLHVLLGLSPVSRGSKSTPYVVLGKQLQFLESSRALVNCVSFLRAI